MRPVVIGLITFSRGFAAPVSDSDFPLGSLCGYLLVIIPQYDHPIVRQKPSAMRPERWRDADLLRRGIDAEY